METQGFWEFQLFRQAFIQIVFWLGGRELPGQETEQRPYTASPLIQPSWNRSPRWKGPGNAISNLYSPETKPIQPQSKAEVFWLLCNSPSHPVTLRTRQQSQNPRLPLAAGPALSSSLWEVPGPGMAMVMKVEGGVKALAGWGGAARGRGLPATLPRTRLSLRMEELLASWGRLASATLSGGFVG